MKSKIIIGGLIAILGLLIAIGPFTFVPVCEYNNTKEDMQEMQDNSTMKHNSHMACYYTARAELGSGWLLFSLGILQLLLRRKEHRVGISIATALIGVYVILIPTVLIGVCGSSSMNCNSLTRPTLITFGIGVVLLSLSYTILLLKGRTERNEIPE